MGVMVVEARQKSWNLLSKSLPFYCNIKTKMQHASSWVICSIIKFLPCVLKELGYPPPFYFCNMMYKGEKLFLLPYPE